MAGRKPLPTAIKKLHGNPGKRKLTAEPAFSGIPLCPEWLTNEARTEWNRIVAELDSLNMLRATDQAALSAYCLAYGRWMTAEAIVSREGQTIKEPIVSKTGKVLGHKIKRHPATTIAKDERMAMLKAASLFGFDPSSRSRIQVGDPATEDPFDSFMRGLHKDPHASESNDSSDVHC